MHVLGLERSLDTPTGPRAISWVLALRKLRGAGEGTDIPGAEEGTGKAQGSGMLSICTEVFGYFHN